MKGYENIFVDKFGAISIDKFCTSLDLGHQRFFGLGYNLEHNGCFTKKKKKIKITFWDKILMICNTIVKCHFNLETIRVIKNVKSFIYIYIYQFI